MTEINLDDKYLINKDSSSKGMLTKYFKNGVWYKLDCNGYESKSEYIVSELLKNSNISDFVEYELCVVNGKNACLSKDFLNHDESFKSFRGIYRAYTGNHLSKDILRINSIEDRVEFVIDFFKEKLNIDIKSYLQRVLWLDYIVKNDDRHFGNLGLVFNSTSKTYRTAPIFDNGSSLLSNCFLYDLDKSIEKNLRKIVGTPFSASLKKQAELFKNPYKFDLEFLNNIENCRAKKVLEISIADIYNNNLMECKLF